MTPGQIGLGALLVLLPLVQESGGTWSVYDRFFFRPQSLPEGEAGGDRPAGDTADHAGTGWNKGGAGDRGSYSSPDPEPEAEWIWWALKIWWLSIGRLADTGLVWCGTLCASVGFAAQWSYWLLVAIVGVFIFQLLIWTVTWVLCPCWRHAKAVVRYVFGKGGWHEVAQLHGISTFRPRWVGPRGQDEWSAEYVQQSVRGRGQNREPHDLLVTDGVAIARLRHGTLRGRTNRFGYRLQGTVIHSASHRYLRNQLDAYNLEVHLCASNPCGLEDDDCLHVCASCPVPRTTELDLQETAGRGPFGRCAVATWFWGCRCAPFTAVWRSFKSMVRCLCRGSCNTRRGRARRSEMGRTEIGTESSTIKHDDSETETEGEDDLTCQADRVSYVHGGQVVPLSEQPCRDVVTSELVRLMDADASRSNQEELVQEDGAYYFAGCNHHRAVYENSINKRRCVIEGCYGEAKLNKDGLRLCKLHAVKEEKPKALARQVKAKAVPKALSSSARPEPSIAVVDENPVPVARIAPGDEDRPDGKPEGEGPALLGTYLRAILQGVTESEALGLVSTPACGVNETRAVLREAATEYLPKLPDDYPAKAREAVVHLVLQPTWQDTRLPAKDPVLGISLPALQENTAKRMVAKVEENWVEEREVPRQDRVATPKPTEEMGWQAFYRPRGSQGFPSQAPYFSAGSATTTGSGHASYGSTAPAPWSVH